MVKRYFQLLVLLLSVLLSKNAISKGLSETIKLFEDEHIVVFDYGRGNIDVKHKSEGKLLNVDYKYQVRKFYNRPIYLGSKNKSIISKIGLDELTNTYIKKATIYQNEHYFNDISVDDSKIKIMHKIEGNSILFYYLKAYYVYEYKNGEFKNYWCDEEHTEYSFVEISINGKTIYFKKIN